MNYTGSPCARIRFCARYPQRHEIEALRCYAQFVDSRGSRWDRSTTRPHHQLSSRHHPKAELDERWRFHRPLLLMRNPIHLRFSGSGVDVVRRCSYADHRQAGTRSFAIGPGMRSIRLRAPLRLIPRPQPVVAGLCSRRTTSATTLWAISYA